MANIQRPHSQVHMKSPVLLHEHVQQCSACFQSKSLLQALAAARQYASPRRGRLQLRFGLLGTSKVGGGSGVVALRLEFSLQAIAS